MEIIQNNKSYLEMLKVGIENSDWIVYLKNLFQETIRKTVNGLRNFEDLLDQLQKILEIVSRTFYSSGMAMLNFMYM